MVSRLLHPIRTAKRAINTTKKRLAAGVVVLSGFGAGGALNAADENVVGQLAQEALRLIHYIVDAATSVTIT